MLSMKIGKFYEETSKIKLWFEKLLFHWVTSFFSGQANMRWKRNCILWILSERLTLKMNCPWHFENLSTLTICIQISWFCSTACKPQVSFKCNVNHTVLKPSTNTDVFFSTKNRKQFKKLIFFNFHKASISFIFSIRLFLRPLLFQVLSKKLREKRKSYITFRKKKWG